MTDNGKITKDDGQAGGALQKLATSATDALVDSVSSLAGSAFEEGANRFNDFSLNVCRENLDRMARQQSIVTAVGVKSPGIDGMVSMSPMIDAMLKVCALSLGGGCTWVVCAPTEQGKTVAAEFLIHGNHCLRPKRSLKIDATNMTDFSKDFATYLKCSAAESCLSRLLCEALTDTVPIADSGEGNLAARATAMTTNLAGKVICSPATAISFGTSMEMRDAQQHKILKVKSARKDGDPSPILIIDEFDCKTEENEKFIKTLVRDANAHGVVVFLMTKEKEWASKLITLNGGTKVKPLPTNVDNSGYAGPKRFTGTPQWNSLFWSVGELRDLVSIFCNEHNLNPAEAIPDGAKLTPGEAIQIVAALHLQRQLSN